MFMALKSTTKKSSKRATTKKVSPEKKLEKSIENTIEAAAECCAHHSSSKNSCCSSRKMNHTSEGSGFYFLGFVGAAIYYISNTSGFWNIILGILKAIVWPAMLVFKLLGM